MGVTVYNKRFSIDLGYIGFNNLRKKVAELTKPDIFTHYILIDKGFSLYGKERDVFLAEYNAKILELDKKYEGKYSHILDFLYESDIEGSLDYKHCKTIWNVIKDYDDNILYGYSGRSDCAKFKDFKAIIYDCYKTKTKMYWN